MTFDPAATAAGASYPTAPVFDHLGPAIEILTRPDADTSTPGLMRGHIAAGGFVPMHSHADPETFFILAGALEGLTWRAPDQPEWVPVEEGSVFHVPPNARHALRNTSGATATTLIISSAAMARFFEQAGTPIASLTADRPAPTPAVIEHMLAEAAGSGHWLAGPADNAAIGIHLPG